MQNGDSIWLTDLGHAIWQAEVKTRHYDTGRRRKARKALIPVWWPKTRQLCLWDREVRHFKKLSPSVEALLEEYRRSGCAPVVRSPFLKRGAKRGHSLRSGLFNINADQDYPKVIFKADNGARTFSRKVLLR
jgi:hypothetical protein